ncbi:hypothetical protein D3C78_1515140 [compost metagenome]
MSVGSEFTIAHTDHTVDARPIVETISRTRSDGVVLCFVVETVFRVVLFQVGERTDHTQWAVVVLVTVLQVETTGLVGNALEIALGIASGYGALTSKCGTCCYGQYTSCYCGKTCNFFHNHLKRVLLLKCFNFSYIENIAKISVKLCL